MKQKQWFLEEINEVQKPSAKLMRKWFQESHLWMTKDPVEKEGYWGNAKSIFRPIHLVIKMEHAIFLKTENCQNSLKQIGTWRMKGPIFIKDLLKSIV